MERRNCNVSTFICSRSLSTFKAVYAALPRVYLSSYVCRCSHYTIPLSPLSPYYPYTACTPVDLSVPPYPCYNFMSWHYTFYFETHSSLSLLALLLGQPLLCSSFFKQQEELSTVLLGHHHHHFTSLRLCPLGLGSRVHSLFVLRCS